MRKRRLSKALAMFLAAALTIPAAVPVAASESTADKEETVYVKRTVLHGMPMEKIFTIKEQVIKIFQYL